MSPPVDTNSNPEDIDFVIPANDDASQSIKLIVGTMTKAVQEGLNERKVEKEKDEDSAPKKPKKKEKREKVVKKAEPKKEVSAEDKKE